VVSYRRSRETRVSLLEDTKSYLGSLLEEKASDQVLVNAWDEFYRMYDALIRRFVGSQGVPHSDVEDCVQEVWKVVVERLGEFERPADRPGLRSWLYTLVRSKVADLFRNRVRQQANRLEPSDLAAREITDADSDPAALFQKRWESALLESVVEELRAQVSEVNYRILRLRLLESCDVSEVAAELKLTPEQVRYRHHRVMRKLRTRLAVFTGEPVDRANR
jgi:RNA polymerase sigma factor (sigma-70 family)